jgi:hypothetical protein
MDHRAQAKRLMTHYMTLIMRTAGLKVDQDNQAELEYLVDNLIDAAKEELSAEGRLTDLPSEMMQEYRHRFPKHFQD